MWYQCISIKIRVLIIGRVFSFRGFSFTGYVTYTSKEMVPCHLKGSVQYFEWITEVKGLSGLVWVNGSSNPQQGPNLFEQVGKWIYSHTHVVQYPTVAYTGLRCTQFRRRGDKRTQTKPAHDLAVRRLVSLATYLVSLVYVHLKALGRMR